MRNPIVVKLADKVQRIIFLNGSGELQIRNLKFDRKNKELNDWAIREYITRRLTK